MHSLYILYSESIDKYYVGESKNADIRRNLHNNHHFKKGFTTAASDWVIVLNFECTSKVDALYLENFIKRMKSTKFIKKIIADREILTDILGNRN
ncbi:GIY-YIG nuclease family protein [Winogradskyella bathintestinalis]|uniref:GIY-YIG nuclease family protein n=1 Tax=Winogradskyella bathintestinalis TaxID=3035208 RepID=A0ABT7ZSJ1_9FLAO|nr:GIY-YIG nuclease family protein [Winogradskyella bathintestinalis]MDN3491982.1 GIY-YIG nuclease family protein [Winogradskyella bathintestinalis]